ncbi:polysaccharide biosynthesis tyrosine autokinase [Cellulomonas sp. JZ18]|uniref:polysaccharide biosynthesis tyrosine autokinase n=1 Tax=Cellulomonas sp. JZ18 TaxID=2654191 RepID=UPI0012D38E7E|nr:polysaccharide biosynthesis tyrosine autokinase [Cellulomonas sp. JZ18]QGQ20148.1 polysaccharide biosynthesis tyrosine autokinase [Cellulomonas sp. JZ18]
MTLRDVLAAVRKHWVLMLLPVLVLAGGIGYLSVTAVPQYRAHAAVYVTIAAAEDPGDLNQGTSYTQAQMLSYARLASLPVVLDPVAAELGLDETGRELAGRVTASTSGDVSILDVSVTSASPDEAAAVANAVVDQMRVAIEDLAPATASGGSAVTARVVEEAVPPSAPFAPSTRRNVLAAGFAGLVLGVLAAWLREALDTRVRRPEDVEAAAGLPVLGTLRALPRSAPELAAPLTATGPAAEDVRRVRANLQMIGRAGRPAAFVVASAVAGEGKTHAAVRIAASFAAAGDRVLLVDADLRRPAVADRIGIEGAVGLTEVLVGRAAFDDVVQDVGDGLSVLPSGAIPPNPSELLSSRELEDLLAQAGERYDLVLVDAPPVLSVADAVLVARRVVGLVVVVDARRTRRPQLRELVDQVRLGGGRVVGAVLNRARVPASAAYEYVAAPPRRAGSRRAAAHGRRGVASRWEAGRPEGSADVRRADRRSGRGDAPAPVDVRDGDDRPVRVPAAGVARGGSGQDTRAAEVPPDAPAAEVPPDAPAAEAAPDAPAAPGTPAGAGPDRVDDGRDATVPRADDDLPGADAGAPADTSAEVEDVLAPDAPRR